MPRSNLEIYRRVSIVAGERDIGSVAAGHAFAVGYAKQMDNIIAVVKIIAGRVHGRDRLLLVAAISRRQLMRHVTLYCRLLRDFFSLGIYHRLVTRNSTCSCAESLPFYRDLARSFQENSPWTF